MTITRGQTVNGTNADPSVVTFGAVTAGQLCIISATERSGNSHTTYSISDNGSNTGWTKVLAEDTQIGDASARRMLAGWWRVLTAADASASPFTVTVDGPATALTMGSTYSDSLGGTWGYSEQSVGDTGTGSTSPLSTGSTPSVSAGELLTYSVAAWRTGTNVTGTAWTNNDGSTSENLPGTSNERAMSHTFGYTTSGGAKSNQVSWTGAGSECTAAILVFEAAAAGGGGGGFPTRSLCLMGIGA